MLVPLHLVFYSSVGEIRASISEDKDNDGFGLRKRLLSGHSSSVTCLVYFSLPMHGGSERHMIASGSSDCTVRLWNIEYRLFRG